MEPDGARAPLDLVGCGCAALLWTLLALMLFVAWVSESAA
jgi:hypothetical protein